MRDWNIFVVEEVDSVCKFKAYLWGIETKFAFQSREYNGAFKAYLWGIETSLAGEMEATTFTFKAYLWGIETP